MNPHTADTEKTQTPAKPTKGWFGRNMLWFLPTVILLPILFCCGGGGGLTWFAMGKMMEQKPYVDTLALLQQDPRVTQDMGSPIESPDLLGLIRGNGTMNLNISNSNHRFDAIVPIEGPNSRGTLFIEAESRDGGATWTYLVREVEIDATGRRINLIGTGSNGPIGPIPFPIPPENSN